jgi:D-glycero-D-manno-heptose 1,7-bisphosphate phosphatase
MSEPAPPAGRPAVFLDRDGTLLDELGYLSDPDRVRLLPGAADAVRALNEAGLPVVVVTNQSGIARGYFTEEDLERVHARLREVLAVHGASLDLVLHSPYHPAHGDPRYRRDSACRKPGPGLLLAARDRLGLDLGRSWVVGDARRDLEAGRRAGVPHLFLVRTGKGAATERDMDADERRRWTVVDDLPAAAHAILRGAPPQGR